MSSFFLLNKYKVDNSSYLKSLALKLALWVTIPFMLISCEDFDNTPELLNKFRAIGVRQAQPTYTYSTNATPVVATLSFFFATPDVDAISVEDFQLESPQLELNFSTPILEESLSALNIYRIDATATLPSENALVFNPAEQNTATVLYAAKFTQGSEEEITLGKIRIYTPEVVASGTIVAPTASITSHTNTQTIPKSDTTLEGDVTNLNDESYRTSWLVSKGVVEDFRKREADWTDLSSGQATIIFTARGLDSYNFTYEAIDVTID